MALAQGRRDPAAAWRHLDLTLLMTVLAVAGYGIVMVWSATRDKLAANGSDPSYYLKRQIVFVVIGLALLVLTASIDYRVFRDFAPIGYVGTIFVLLAVLYGQMRRERG